MRIAFIVTSFPKLSETFILNQITGLIDRGHNVDIFAASPSAERVCHDDVRNYGLLKRTFYFQKGCDELTMPDDRLERAWKGMGLMIGNFLRRPGCLIRSLNFLRFGREASSLSLFYKAIRFVSEMRYDIIHCHFGPNGIVGSTLKDIGAVRAPVITTFHGSDLSKAVKRNGDDLYSALFSKGDLFLPVSERWKDELLRIGCEDRKIAVHRMGIDVSRFPFIPRVRTEDSPINILTVGRLVEKKGLKYGIHAVARLIEKRRDVTYKIVGDGPLRNEIETLIRTYGIQNRVEVLGWRPQKAVSQLMNASHIFMAPSLTAEDGDQEGIPVVLMEAMAQGMPVLSTWHSGIPELVQDGKSGFLVAERDIDHLSERLDHLVEHPEIWPEMGNAGRDAVVKHYNIDSLNDRLINIYQGLISGGLRTC